MSGRLLARGNLDQVREAIRRPVWSWRYRPLRPVPQLLRGVPERRLVLMVHQVALGALRRVTRQPAGAVVRPRIRAVVLLAGRVQPELLEHRAIVLRLGAEGGQEVAHHHSVETRLDGERLQLPEVLD